MALSIKHPEADRLARELARRTGQTMTEAIVQALREKLDRLRTRGKASLADELVAIGRKCAKLPVQDPRAADEILGYDQHGTPH